MSNPTCEECGDTLSNTELQNRKRELCDDCAPSELNVATDERRATTTVDLDE